MWKRRTRKKKKLSTSIRFSRLDYPSATCTKENDSKNALTLNSLYVFTLVMCLLSLFVCYLSMVMCLLSLFVCYLSMCPLFICNLPRFFIILTLYLCPLYFYALSTFPQHSTLFMYYLYYYVFLLFLYLCVCFICSLYVCVIFLYYFSFYHSMWTVFITLFLPCRFSFFCIFCKFQFPVHLCILCVCFLNFSIKFSPLFSKYFLHLCVTLHSSDFLLPVFLIFLHLIFCLSYSLVWSSLFLSISLPTFPPSLFLLFRYFSTYFSSISLSPLCILLFWSCFFVYLNFLSLLSWKKSLLLLFLYFFYLVFLISLYWSLWVRTSQCILLLHLCYIFPSFFFLFSFYIFSRQGKILWQW